MPLPRTSGRTDGRGRRNEPIFVFAADGQIPRMKSGELYSTLPPSLPPSRLTRGGWAEMEKSVRSFVRSLARCGVRCRVASPRQP